MRVTLTLLSFTAFSIALLLQATTPIPIRFVDVASAIGMTSQNSSGGITNKNLILETTGNGAAIIDFNNDGANDVVIANGANASGEGQSPQLYRNDGHGHFQNVAGEAGLTAKGWGQGVCAGDFDNDGNTDLLLTYFGHNVLYRNQGNGKFEDVTAKAGLPVSGSRWGSGCAFFDYDHDGKLDLFVANYVDLDPLHTPKPGSSDSCRWKEIAVMCGPRGLPLAHNALYHNNGDGTFTDVSESAGILKPGGRYGLGVVTADFDNDGWPDIYVACDMTPSLLYRNRGNGTFEERGIEAGVAYNFDGRLQAGMGVAVADYDGNGLLDIAKTNFSGDLTSLYRNDDGHYLTDASQRAGLGSHQLLGWGAAFLDIDDDGWPDLITANGHVYPEVEGAQVGDHYLQKTLLFRNLGNGRFRDITDESGPGFAAARPARGLAVGDLDGDGQPEIVIVNMNAAPTVLRNESPRGKWLRITLRGTRSNRSAIGSRVTVTAGGRQQLAELVGGGSYFSQNEFALYFGLGNAASVDRVDVRWPKGELQTLRNVAVNHTLAITEK